MITGVITSWDEQGGVGLVTSPEEVPKNIEPIVDEEIVGRSLDLQVGDVIEYELGEGSQGWIVSEVVAIEGEPV